jgi:hypothetical protein
MSARTRRIQFASSFVITLAGCGGRPPKHEPPTPPIERQKFPEESPEYAPATGPDQPATPMTWLVDYTAGAGCAATPQPPCGDGDPHCKPIPFACLPLTNGGIQSKTVARVNGETACVYTIHVMPNMSCPKNASCNPPPPHDESHSIRCPDSK